MTWSFLRAKLPQVCMMVLSLVNLLLLLQIRLPDRLDLPRSTIRVDWHGWDPTLAQATAPLGVPTRPPPQPPAQKLVLWTAPPDTREEEAMLSRLGPQPRKRHWLGLESRQDSGPARESGTDVSVPRRDDPQDTAYTGSKAAEQRILLHMAPRRKPRPRPPPSSRYDQLVLLAEQSAQRRHDALYGPSLGAGLDRTLEAVQQTPVVDSRLDLQAMD